MSSDGLRRSLAAVDWPCALAGKVVAAKPKATVRRKALRDRGYDVSGLPNIRMTMGSGMRIDLFATYRQRMLVKILSRSRARRISAQGPSPRPQVDGVL